MSFYDILIVATAGAYAAEMLYLGIGISRASGLPRKDPSFTPFVSVIVAARNEETFIAGCLTSIAMSDYPADKFEIIAVNDHSTDNTGPIIRDLCSKFPNLRLIETGAETTNLKGKTNAVNTGIRAAKGEFLLFTDADCHVPPTWVRETVRLFTDDVGVTGGFTKLQSNSAFGGMQALDWIMLFGMSSAAVGWNLPITAIGNNLAVRRAAYDETGGFENIPFSVTEDYALVQAILTRTRYTLAFPLDASTIVTSNPCSTWRQLYRQKQRWGVGGLDMVFRGVVIMTIPYSFMLLLFAGLFVASPLVLLGGLAAKSVIESLYILRPLSRMNARSYFKYLPAFIPYYILYILATPIVSILSKRVVWKERSL